MNRAIGSGLAVQGPPAITNGCAIVRSSADKRNSAQIQHREHVAVAEVVLQRETQHVEVAKRRELFKAPKRQAVPAKQLLHILQRRERSLALPTVAAIHNIVEHLKAVVAHADGVGVGKCKAQLSAHGAIVLNGASSIRRLRIEPASEPVATSDRRRNPLGIGSPCSYNRKFPQNFDRQMDYCRRDCRKTGRSRFRRRKTVNETVSPFAIG